MTAVAPLYDQELESHFDIEACVTRDGIAVALIGHEGCPSPTPMCARCVAMIRRVIAHEPDVSRTHLRCGARVAGKDLDIRPI